jgi:copper transport protein
VDVNPAATGPNTIRVTVRNSRGDPYDVAELDATVTLTSQTLASRRLGPFPVPLQRTGPNGYVADGFQLPMRGTWMFEATVRTSDIDRTTVVTSIEIR